MKIKALFIIAIMAVMTVWVKDAKSENASKGYDLFKKSGKSGVAFLKYTSYEELREKIDLLPENEKLTDAKKDNLISDIPKGGQFVLLYNGYGIGDSRLRELTIVVKDKEGNELLKRISNSRSVSLDLDSWQGKDVLFVPFSMPDYITIYIFRSHSDGKIVYRMKKEK